MEGCRQLERSRKGCDMEEIKRVTGVTRRHLRGTGAKSWTPSTDLGVWPPALQGKGGSWA